jgi:hypothetical protein
LVNFPGYAAELVGVLQIRRGSPASPWLGTLQLASQTKQLGLMAKAPDDFGRRGLSIDLPARKNFENWMAAVFNAGSVEARAFASLGVGAMPKLFGGRNSRFATIKYIIRLISIRKSKAKVSIHRILLRI